MSLAAFIIGGMKAHAQADTLINFDNLPVGTIVTNQYLSSGVSFTSNSFVRVTNNCGFCVYSSTPNAVAGGPDNFGETILNFSQPMKNFTFWMAGCESYGAVAKVDIYENGVYARTLNLLGQPSYYPGFFDLSQYGTKITNLWC